MSSLRLGRVCALAVTLVVASALGPFVSSRAAADAGTPTGATPVPEQTATPTGIPSIAVATSLPTVMSEGPSPEMTFEATPFIPTMAPVPSITPVTESQPSATPMPTPDATTSQSPGSSSTLVMAPWPSPSELRQNARLRWGHGIPASVRRWAFLVVPAARAYHIDPNLLAAVMTMESNGDPLALSPADARGLMQILHGPWDPKMNVYVAARMLASLHGEFGNWTLALAAYNAGPGAVLAAGGVPPFRETRDYVIVVGYLWDLYGRHHLSFARRTEYRRTLSDLARFKDQRKKVAKLARIAHIADLTLTTCPLGACLGSQPTTRDNVLDPFWPVGGSPDPLQRVGPIPNDLGGPRPTG